MKFITWTEPLSKVADIDPDAYYIRAIRPSNNSKTVNVSIVNPSTGNTDVKVLTLFIDDKTNRLIFKREKALNLSGVVLAADGGPFMDFSDVLS